MNAGSEGSSPFASQPLSGERWTTLEPLIDAALALPAAQRQEYIDQACASDAELGRQLARLLSQYARPDGLLEHPAAARFAALLRDRTQRLPAVLGGRYRVEHEIGRGGMATVYLANDIRHGRKVAVKVLHPDLAAAVGAERFLAEIKMTAQLQHPHILPLYDSGEVDGVLFYVMPFVEGESLRRRISREQQLPVDDAVRIASEVASALEAAHAQGVVHRDIKPENILFLNGTALVADFGIALAVGSSDSPRITNTGLTVGTPQYMSPEQATGARVIDGRSDIYSLGAVLYEMLAGEPPFTGITSAAIVAKLLALPAPSLCVVRTAIPVPLDKAIARALAREPADRYRTAAAFAAALKRSSELQVARTAAANDSDATTPSQRRWIRAFVKPRQIAVIALVVAGVLVAPPAWRSVRQINLRTGTSILVPFHGDLQTVGAGGPTVAFSPDGKTIAFVGSGPDGASQLFVRPTNDTAARRLAGTAGATMPFFSPDGNWLGFFAAGKLKKVSLDGTTVLPITDAARVLGASWSRRGVIVMGSAKGLVTVPATGGSPLSLTKPDTARGEEDQRWPVVLGDGETVLFTSWSRGGIEAARIGVARLGTGRSTIFDLPGTFPLGVVDGLLVYANPERLMAVRFDAARDRIVGDPAPIVTDVFVGMAGAAKAGISRDGTILYQHGLLPLTQLVISDAHGVMRPLLPEWMMYTFPRISPDGSKVAMTVRTLAGTVDIWIYDLNLRTTLRITTDNRNWGSEWTPDSKRVLYLSSRGDRQALWWQPVDLSGPPSQLLRTPNDNPVEGVISSDGRTLVYETETHAVWYRHLSGDTTSRPLVGASPFPTTPRLSPDGRWLAFVSNESGTTQVVVQPFPGPGARVQVSVDGGIEPVWTSYGHRLVYQHNEQFIAAELATNHGFIVTSRTLLFKGNFYRDYAGGYNQYDASLDGTQFVLLKMGKGREMTVLREWQRDVRARLSSNAAK